MEHLKLQDFPLVSFDKLRYADTDRQGHVNNAVFSTFLETGRVEFLFHEDMSFIANDISFVIASLNMNLRKEIVWPGRVDIGTAILRIGNSSITLYQHIYQNEVCAAVAETVIVQTKNSKSYALSARAKSLMQQWMMKE